jgi:PAS domain S-box-containing protein
VGAVRDSSIAHPDNQLFSGTGEMARLMREKNWATTSLGPPDAWPRSLRVAVRILLGSGYPMYIAWGPEFIQLYNDAYRPILGRLKHPSALGIGSPETFPELWEFIGPMFWRVLNESQETTLLGQALFLNRNGYLEECYYDFSYSPIPTDDLGGVGGVLVTCTEVTNAVLEQRRLKTVRDLGSGDTQAQNAEDVCSTSAEVLSQNQLDLPFAAIYLIDESAAIARLAGVSGAAPGDPLCPVHLSVAEDGLWPIRTLLESSSLQRVPDLRSRFSVIPTGGWPDPPQEAVLLPLPQSIGFIIAGVNPRKQFDDAMEQFLVRCAGAIGGRLINVRAFEDARRRAESLAELDRAKTVFFSNISHEFRTPLTLIGSPLEDLAASPGLSEADRETVHLAQRNVIRLQRLVNNLLDFSRIEAGRVAATFEPVDLAAFTAELASGFRSTFQKAGLSLDVQARPLSEPIYIDREIWEKILLNVLSNAFKFTLEGGVAVEITEDAATVAIHVTDTGVGIPAAELPRIFERFHRSESSRGRSYEGIGIGLALVHELVRIQGGTVEVFSQEGAGSRFTVTLRKGTAHLDPERIRPAAAPAIASSRLDGFVMEALRWIDAPLPEVAVVTEPAASPALTAGVIGTGGRKPRVLVADDNADMRQYFCRLLEPAFEVEIATHGEEALRKIHGSRPDLVLTDAMMPVMDGYSLLHRIRSTPGLATLPVIMVSARAGGEMEIEGREAGADDYITKPFSGRELIARVGSALKIAEVRASSEAALRESENRSREILERTTDAVFVLDREWRFSYLNRNAVAIIANGRDLTGRNVWQEFPDAVGTEFWRKYHQVMDESVSVQFHEYYPHPLDKWFEVHAYPTDEGIAVFFRDITSKLRAEAALRQSEKLAAVGRMASSIAHEINNPLEAITNLLYLIDGDPNMQASTRQYLQTAQAELSRVSHIATQTLRFHRHKNQCEPVRMTEVLDSVLALFAARLSQPGISIDRQYRSDTRIIAFPVELRQVFSNLLRNALDAVGSHGTIVVRERRSSHPRTGVPGTRITIADSGTGISAEARTRLFEPFFSTKGSIGTGLGLWVSKEIVDKHSGEIYVRSSTDPNHHGTVFSVFLPLEHGDPASAAA